MTVTARLVKPVAVGVPDIIPVLVLMVSPVGSCPVRVKLYGATPPLVLIASE